MIAVALINPKYPHNVGAALRACSIFGAQQLLWTGDRIPAIEQWPEGARLPREERMKLYADVRMQGGVGQGHVLLGSDFFGMTPVCVEKSEQAEELDHFIHPKEAIYVFGPEDGNVPKAIRHYCHRFVCIPTVQGNSPLNLASAVNVVLYDRLAKERRRKPDGYLTMQQHEQEQAMGRLG